VTPEKLPTKKKKKTRTLRGKAGKRLANVLFAASDRKIEKKDLQDVKLKGEEASGKEKQVFQERPIKLATPRHPHVF